MHQNTIRSAIYAGIIGIILFWLAEMFFEPATVFIIPTDAFIGFSVGALVQVILRETGVS